MLFTTRVSGVCLIVTFTSPEESVDVKVTIKQTPLTLVVKSIGGGQGQPVGQLTIR